MKIVGVGSGDRRDGGPSRRRKRRHWDFCDGCGSCDLPCDGPDCCDFGLFSMLLTLGAVLAGSGGRAGTGSARRAGKRDRAGLAAIRLYRRWLSHRWPGQCRYVPTCSAYGLEAVDRYGLAVGGRMAADRLRRCRRHVPPGTADPVRRPEPDRSAAVRTTPR